jgi:hypothetical protein
MADTTQGAGDSPAPDGIEERHWRPLGSLGRHASPLALVAFGLVVALALSGLLGREATRRAQGSETALSVHAPEIIRNGEFFEVRIRIEPEQPIATLTIGIEQSLLEDMTVNTMIPAASGEESADGEFRFAFGALEPGTAFLAKIDVQVNPDIVGGNDGAITVYDGETPLVEVPVSIAVLP